MHFINTLGKIYNFIQKKRRRVLHNDSVGLTTSMLCDSTIAQESQQNALRGRVLAFYRIAPCLRIQKMQKQ